MVTPDERQEMWQIYAPQPRMRLNLGIRRRLAPLLDGDRRKIELLYAILFTLPGSPILYYGDEIGMGDNIWLDDRDGVRTPMQWNADANVGFSTAPLEKFYAPPIDDEIFGYKWVNVAIQRGDPGSLWHTIRKMIAVRKEQTALSYGDTTLLPVANPAVLAILRGCLGDSVLALANLSASPQSVEVDLSSWFEESLHDLLKPDRSAWTGDKLYSTTLLPYEYSWLKL